jgi:hypothetical protein
MSGYQIADEPKPSPLARLAVNPLFPFLAVMLGGVWIAWPWFAFNSFAIGSPTRKREIAWLVGGILLALLLTAAVFVSVGLGALPVSGVPYAMLVITVVKLAVLYAVFLLQSRTIEIYQYYGGKLATGVWVLVLSFYFRSPVIDALPDMARLVLG